MAKSAFEYAQAPARPATMLSGQQTKAHLPTRLPRDALGLVSPSARSGHRLYSSALHSSFAIVSASDGCSRKSMAMVAGTDEELCSVSGMRLLPPWYTCGHKWPSNKLFSSLLRPNHYFKQCMPCPACSALDTCAGMAARARHT